MKIWNIFVFALVSLIENNTSQKKKTTKNQTNKKKNHYFFIFRNLETTPFPDKHMPFILTVYFKQIHSPCFHLMLRISLLPFHVSSTDVADIK